MKKLTREQTLAIKAKKAKAIAQLKSAGSLQAFTKMEWQKVVDEMAQFSHGIKKC